MRAESGAEVEGVDEDVRWRGGGPRLADELVATAYLPQPQAGGGGGGGLKSVQ